GGATATSVDGSTAGATAADAAAAGAATGAAATAAADVHSIPAARLAPGQPDRGIADGDVLGRRRHRRGLPPGAPGGPGARRRRPGVHRDDLRCARGP